MQIQKNAKKKINSKPSKYMLQTGQPSKYLEFNNFKNILVITFKTINKEYSIDRQSSKRILISIGFRSLSKIIKTCDFTSMNFSTKNLVGYLDKLLFKQLLGQASRQFSKFLLNT